MCLIMTLETTKLSELVVNERTDKQQTGLRGKNYFCCRKIIKVLLFIWVMTLCKISVVQI